MARYRRDKPKIPRFNGSQWGTRGSGGQLQTNNTYANLLDDQAGPSGEMNAHLTERFNSFRVGDRETSQPDPSRVPMSLPGPKPEIWEYFVDAEKPVNGGSWLEKPEIPTSSEILPSPASLTSELIDLNEEIRPNKVEGAYDNTEEYLGTQYDLIREDAIRPLRKAVEQVQQSPWLIESEYPNGSSIGIYEPVYINSLVFSPRGIATRVAFSLGRVKKYVRWQQSKRLITGTLVALSPADDAFRTKCVLAVVAARPLAALEQNPPEIDLFFARAEDFEIDPMKKWIMVESRSSFFEASRHTLLALQHMMREPFPLSNHLVKVQKEVEPPSYVQRNPHTNMSSLVAMDAQEASQNVNILQEWPSSASHALDTSQSMALKAILTKRLAIIQGPPGTGKTYVSVVALKILLDNMRRGDPPIIVTCQTNHALDQLLRHVAEFEPSFIRLGGRSKDKDKIKARTLFEVRSSVSQPKAPGSRKSKAIGAMFKLTKTMQMLLAPLEANKPPLDHKVLLGLGLITPEQAKSLEDAAQNTMGIEAGDAGLETEQWLGKCLVRCDRPYGPDDFGIEFEEEDFEVEKLKELEAEAVARDDDDIETLRGAVTLLSDNYAGKGRSNMTDGEVRKLLDITDNLDLIPTRDRGTIYNYFLRQAKRRIRDQFRELAKEYEKHTLLRRVGQWDQDFRLLYDQRLIGMTTTGLSKYRGLISELKPRIVLVEEAAETLEAPVIAACVPSLEHLILVGDHQQLRPHCQVREFEDEPYNFNLSLFERLVANDIDYKSLNKQRRMIPEIRRLLEPIYGDTLKDHPNVKDIHNRPPTRDGNMSSLNEKEAEMIVRFYDYLVLNFIDPSKITVLTFYNGQRKTIHKKLASHPNLRTHGVFNVVTVDSYQGEENDIVLLSLVRSNRRHDIGFLKVDNRVCVALSRAKRGFYIFGNAELLACESSTWAEVVDIMYGKRAADNPRTGQKRRVGYHLPIECTNHGHKNWIQDPSDWQYLSGGCDQPCRCRLPCGHTCMLRCHPFDNTRINCTQPCTKRVASCGHACTKMCCDPCRCQTCEGRADGMKPLLRPVPAHGMASFQPSFPSSMISPAFQPPKKLESEPTAASSGTDGTPENWKAYANGGAREDDAKAKDMMKEQQAAFSQEVARAAGPPSAQLIELSPPKKLLGKLQESSNMNLLLDLDDAFLAQPKPTRYRSKETYTHAAAAAAKPKKTNKPVFNLLD
ncbi:P-loop containing nucleoside triphosphate hydrolase protein [Massariosphaeria phaeospora]|uniref:P-loop containing nucleoside triphosphate hydrolase protein n=1 Tax=Massariosphaeria phaeospora TaxID=100035 RepID=A0A7C8M9E7_9PLEO|nr:P-loop containing nucleoside triphosphate hydrolase protein [Massariosphaeria phaeospora]